MVNVSMEGAYNILECANIIQVNSEPFHRNAT